MLSPDERYLRDPMFRALVDVLEAQIHNAQYTPSELREAVILAATRYEMRRPPRPMYVAPDGSLLRPDDPPRPLAVYPNEGHGHVYPRPDGVKARCGGPGICAACALDAERKRQEDSRTCARCSTRNTIVQHGDGAICPFSKRGDPASERAGDGRHTP
jgi:hypothetical protein